MVSSSRQLLREGAWATFALLLSAILILLAFIARYEAPDSSAAARISIMGHQLSPVVGRAEVHEGGLRFTEYQPQDGKHHAIAVWRSAFKAADYPIISLDFAAEDPGLAVNLTWKRADAGEQVFSTELSRENFGPPALVMSEQPGWYGKITEVGLYAISTQPGMLTINSLTLKPRGWDSRIRALISEWTTFRGWTPRTINYMRFFPGESGVSPLPHVALWGGLAIVILFVVGLLPMVKAFSWRAYLVLALTPWLLLDLLWQRELNMQLEVTRDRFAGKSLLEKHLVDDDAWIFKAVNELKRDVLPAEPVRIIIIHSHRGHNYERLKTQYYLLPHNVYNFGKGPHKNALRQGDYLLVMRGTHDPAYSPERGQLEWRKRSAPVQVKPLNESPLGWLYQVTDPSVRKLQDG